MDKLKPSQLLRLGAKQIKHCRGTYFCRENGNGPIVKACAVGMIAIAKAGSLDVLATEEALGELTKEYSSIRIQGRPFNEDLSDFIATLNDKHKRTPEQIAQRLEKEGY